jgi:lipid-binding SYLF domain-containing protein
MELEALVDESRLTFARFVGNPSMGWFRDRARNARAVFIAPKITRASYFFGASWGTGVLLVRNSATGRWSQPAFYRITGLSFGLQIGALYSEIVALATNDAAADEMKDGVFTLGISGALGAGRYGGVLSGLFDIRSGSGSLIVGSPTGFFAGVSAGATLALVRDSANELYYGHPVELDQLKTSQVSQWYSDRLVKTLNDLSLSDP